MPIEDFTTYEEVDPNGRITVTADRSTFTLLSRDEDAYVYKDKGVNHFDGDFEHLIEMYPDAAGSSYFGHVGIWVLSNDIDDLQGLKDAGKSYLGLEMEGAIGYNPYLRLYEQDGANSYSDQSIALSWDTLYYLKIKRVETDGEFGTIYCDIYTSEEDRANEVNAVDNLSLVLHSSKKDFRYIFATCSKDSNLPVRTLTGYSQNFDLQEVPPPPPIFPDAIYSPRTKENKKGIIYDAEKTEIGYAEDITKLDDEVVAIEDFLLPQYIFAHENNVIPVAVAGTFIDIPFNEQVSTPKVGIEHDHESNPEQFKIKKAGVYLINMTCSFSDSAVVPDCHIDIRIVKNGVEIHGSLLEKDIAGGPQQDKDKTITNSILVACALDDIIKFQFTSDDLTVSLDSDATYGDHKDTAVINIIRIA